jgi:hypothetical protein
MSIKKTSRLPGPAKSAPKHLYTLISELVLRDTYNRFSFINVIHNIALDDFPGALSALYITVAFTGGVGQRFSVWIEDPNSKEYFRFPTQQDAGLPVEDRSGDMRRRVSVTEMVLRPAVFVVEGMYKIILSVGDKIINEEPFYVGKVTRTEEADHVSG